ncbi:MAG: NAD(P)-binding domain-containing protein [Anaerolineales bacterium]|nr:NAD(P)-binding domain-containing protein [Anaerolineales bacterium]
MDIGIFGTGIVGQTIGTRLIELGHDVKMGSRLPENENARAWAKAGNKKASYGTYKETAAFGKLLFNCTAGRGSLSAFEFARASDLNNKILIDVSNPLDFSRGLPPTLTVCNTDSLGEQLQRAHPLLKVVKALNTMNVDVMVHPERVRGAHDVFICGNDAIAKAAVSKMLTEFGWESIIDLGDIINSRGMEMALPLWISLQKKLGTNIFNFKVVK